MPPLPLLAPVEDRRPCSSLASVFFFGLLPAATGADAVAGATRLRKGASAVDELDGDDEPPTPRINCTSPIRA